jgi:hypothetical protein
MAAKTAGRDVAAELAFLTRALKAPTLREAVPRLAGRARAESWTHEEFLAACLQREVSAQNPTAAGAASALPGSPPARPWTCLVLILRFAMFPQVVTLRRCR